MFERMFSKPDATLDNETAHFQFLSNLDSKQQWAIKYLYDRLGIVDSKASSLLRFNGVVLGFVSVAAMRLIDYIERPPDGSPAESDAHRPWQI